MSRRFLVSVSNYSIGNILFGVAGIISFPILTRLLTVQDYGLLALIGTTLLFIVSLAKLGIQHATLRFYTEIKQGQSQWSLDNYYATVIFGMAAVGILITLVWLLFVGIAPSSLWNSAQLPFLLMLTASLILIRTLDSVLCNILRAREYTGIYSIYRVFKRYLTLILVLVTLFFIMRTLTGYFIATIIVECLSLLILGYYLFSHNWPSLTSFSMPLLRKMMLYGIPMMGFELGSTILDIGDKYIIQWFVGAAALGAYAAGYTFIEMVYGVITVGFIDAVIPMYLRIWSEKGQQETQQFINRALYYYLLIVIPVVAGLCAVGPELLLLLASDKYQDAVNIIPYIAFGLAINGTVVLLGAGLYIKKQSKQLMYLVLIAAIINIALNLVLVPLYGIEGAAAATVFSYLSLALLTYKSASSSLSIEIPWVSAIKFSLVSLCMYILVTNIHSTTGLLNVMMQIVTGIFFYGVFILVVDYRARSTLQNLLVR